ncbi:hypothetical protein ACTXT7_004959 [Hymenolepis weldensis]
MELFQDGYGKFKGSKGQYFVDYKLNTTISEKADYRINFLGYIGIASQLPNLIMAAFNTFFQKKSSTSNPTFRFMVVMGLELVILIFTTIMLITDRISCFPSVSSASSLLRSDNSICRSYKLLCGNSSNTDVRSRGVPSDEVFKCSHYGNGEFHSRYFTNTRGNLDRKEECQDSIVSNAELSFHNPFHDLICTVGLVVHWMCAGMHVGMYVMKLK